MYYRKLETDKKAKAAHDAAQKAAASARLQRIAELKRSAK